MSSLNFKKYAPKEKLLPSEWAERHVLIGASNARPGKISFREAPFQKGILDTIVDPKINRISVMSAAQIGKTMIALCVLGYFTEHEPMSQIMMQPTQPDLRKWLEGKFDPMVAANPILQKTYAKPRGREGVNNSEMKAFAGGILYLAWAGSQNSQRGISAPIICTDETDAYGNSEEGHPVNLLRQRSETFGEKRKLLELSTPTVKNKSWIEQAYLQGDQRKFWVICPHCSEKQTLEWKQVRWEEDDVSTARMYCKKCDYGFNDTERIKLVRYAESDGGGWQPERETRNHASFQLSALYSPLRRLQDIVQNFIDVDSDVNQDLSVFYNTVLGETYEHTGDTADEHELASRTEDYQQVPKGVKIITAAIDVQKERLECEVVGWGKDEERWNLDYQIFHGDTSDYRNDCYKNAIKYLSKGLACEGGGFMFVSGIGIDIGYNAMTIYDVIHRHGRKMPPIFAVKGVGGWLRDEIVTTKPQIMPNGKYRPPVHSLAVDKLKQVLMKRLNITEIGAGYCHFPHERSGTEYFKQLTSEVLMFNKTTGKWKWQKKDADANEALDCAVYNYAVLHILSPDLSIAQRHNFTKGGKSAQPKKRQKHIKNKWV